MEISEELRQFYRELQNLIDRDFTDPPEWFDHKGGLCFNLISWAETFDIIPSHHTLQAGQQSLFKDEGLDTIYPFNQNWAGYDDENAQGLLWENPARLSFIKNQLEGG